MTAYELRISDWSSDVCSSDLAPQTNSAPNSSSSVPANPAHTNPALAQQGQPPRGNGQPDPSAIISAMAQGPQPGARSIATPSDAPHVGADGRVWVDRKSVV